MKNVSFLIQPKTIILLFSILILPEYILAQVGQYNSTEYILKNYKKNGSQQSPQHFNDILKRKINKWNSVPLDYKFFLESPDEFRKFQALTANTNYSNYKEFALELKFYTTQESSLLYKPTLVKKELLYDDAGYFIRATEKRTNYNLGPGFDFKKHNEELFIRKPELVHFIWAKIPSPHRDITENRHLSRKSAKEGIEALLPAVTQPKKLEKPVEKTGPWTTSGKESVSLSQTYLSNWTQGGENTVAIASDLKLIANYEKEKVEWESYVRDKIGIVNSESYPTQINNDNFEVNSKYGLQASKKWYYSTLFNFQSQIFNVYNNDDITSSLLSPAYFTLAFGMDFKKDKNFTLLLSPITFKLTYVMDTVKVDQTDYSIDEDKKHIFTNGASITNTWNWEISTELSLESSLTAFIGYLDPDPTKQVDWELIFNMRVNQYLSTKLNTNLRYYTNESDKLQLKEYLAISFNYKF